MNIRQFIATYKQRAAAFSHKAACLNMPVNVETLAIRTSIEFAIAPCVPTTLSKKGSGKFWKIWFLIQLTSCIRLVQHRIRCIKTNGAIHAPYTRLWKMPLGTCLLRNNVTSTDPCLQSTMYCCLRSSENWLPRIPLMSIYCVRHKFSKPPFTYFEFLSATVLVLNDSCPDTQFQWLWRKIFTLILFFNFQLDAWLRQSSSAHSHERAQRLLLKRHVRK